MLKVAVKPRRIVPSAQPLVFREVENFADAHPNFFVSHRRMFAMGERRQDIGRVDVGNRELCKVGDRRARPAEASATLITGP